MYIKFVDQSPDAKEVGFIHSNGALVLFPRSKVGQAGPVVINGWQGNYETSDEDYFIWRADAIRILYEGDKVEITL
jgi:hypothetical protein